MYDAANRLVHVTETGLYYHLHRYYDPRIGRYLSVDLIGLAGGDFNLYRYVRNNPVTRIDPYGLDTWVARWEQGWNVNDVLQILCCHCRGNVGKKLVNQSENRIILPVLIDFTHKGAGKWSCDNIECCEINEGGE